MYVVSIPLKTEKSLKHRLVINGTVFYVYRVGQWLRVAIDGNEKVVREIKVGDKWVTQMRTRK